MKQTIAMYRNVEMGYTFIAECEVWDVMDDIVRITDPVDVEFAGIVSADDVVKEFAVAAAQKELDAAQAKLNGLINE